MNKKIIVTFLCLFSMGLFITGTCFASLYTGPVVLVEADGGTDDGDMTVTFTVTDFSGWTVGEWISGSGFQPFPTSTVTKPGGNVVDFAINDGSGTTHKLSDGNNPVTFLNQNTGNVQAPSWVTTWYDDLIISWSTLSSTLNISIFTTDGNPDGLAPVPIPATVWIFGAGLVGLVGIRRKLRS